MTSDEAKASYERTLKMRDEALHQLNQLSAALVNALDAYQRACPHPTDLVFQGECYRSDPPFRVCQACGYAEEGWGHGYTKLTICYDHNIVARRKAVDFVRGGIIPNRLHSAGQKDG
jgi:hypothetical protein